MSHSTLAPWVLRSLAGLIVAGGALVGPAAAIATNHPTRGTHRLLEAATCQRRTRGAPVSGQLTIAVTVPAVALLRVDARGRIIAAATNTGCRPRQGDIAYVVQPDGSLVADHRVRPDIVDWTGDFRVPGRMQPQVIDTH